MNFQLHIDFIGPNEQELKDALIVDIGLSTDNPDMVQVGNFLIADLSSAIDGLKEHGYSVVIDTSQSRAG